jgi:hypothetical protein
MGIHGLKLVLTYDVINAWDYLQCGRATSRAPPIAIDVWHLEVGQGLDAGHNGTRGGCSLVPYTASRLAASPTDTAIRALVSPHRLGAVRAGLDLRAGLPRRRGHSQCVPGRRCAAAACGGSFFLNEAF